MKNNDLQYQHRSCQYDAYIKFGLIKSFFLKILRKNQIMTSIKNCNTVANLQKTIIYITNVDLVNDDVYTRFGLILSISSQDIE